MMVEQASNFLNRLRQRWQRALSKRRAINELAACPPSELRRIASEVGLNGDDLVRLSCSHSGPSELLPRRLNLWASTRSLSGMRHPSFCATLRVYARPARHRAAVRAIWLAATRRSAWIPIA